MKITIEFDTGNAAFQDDDKDLEIATIMKHVTDKMYDGYTEGRINDSNGNHIGYWNTTDTPRG